MIEQSAVIAPLGVVFSMLWLPWLPRRAIPNLRHAEIVAPAR
jgi:hypothetical protein